MIRENAKKNIDIISAFAEGKTIQYKTDTGSWHDLTENEGLPMGTLSEEPNMFRIKPEPKCRPFANAKECWQEMQKHQPFGWVKTKDKGIRLCMSGLNQKSAFTQVGYKYDEAFDEFIFADGFPFGVKVKE